MRDRLLELQHLTGAPGGAARDEILKRVADLFLLTCDRQTASDREVFGDVMQRLADQVAPQARCELAHRLATVARPPETLIRRLARDNIDVARPLLERSPALDEQELIDIVRTGSLAHSDAICRRPRLTAALVEALLDRADDVMLTEIAANPEAELPAGAFALMAERAADNAELRHALLERSDLPGDIRARLRPQSNPEVAPELAAERDLRAWHEDAAVETAPPPMADSDTDTARPPGEAQLAELARAGKLEAAIAALSALTGLTQPMIRTCLLSAEVPALVVLCKAHEFASTTFSALLELRLSVGAITTKGVASAMRRYETMDAGMARRIMRFLKVRLAHGSDAQKETGDA